jgi:hypothetical protein
MLDRLYRPHGVASVTPAQRERERDSAKREREQGREIWPRERERDLAIFWGGARPPLGQAATPSHLRWSRGPPRSWGGLRATLDPDLGWPCSPPQAIGWRTITPDPPTTPDLDLG